MINQANRHPGHATSLSTRPVETIRPHMYFSKELVTGRYYAAVDNHFNGFYSKVQPYFAFLNK